MATTKIKKNEIINNLKENFKNQKSVFLFDYKKLSTNDIAKIRKELKKIGANLKIAKKTLIKIAFNNFEKEKFKEQVALVFGYKDEVAPAKIIYKFSESNNNLKILGGYLKNDFIDDKEIIKLAKLKSKEELLGRLVFVMKNSISRLVGALSGNTKKLVFVLNAIKETKK